jgi:hypothetical protein
MLSGSLLAVFWVVIALIGAMSGFVCVLGWGKGR